VPELPEVEVVRDGLARWVSGRTVDTVEVLHPRAIRRHVTGPADFGARIAGQTFAPAQRRGKYLWLPLDSGEAVTAHLGMSGQLLVEGADAPDEKHLRIRFTFTDGGRELRFVDQRTFGGLAVDDLVEVEGTVVPTTVAHIARDPLDPLFDDARFVAGLRARKTGLKRALLDQTLVSGIGNIYADEALWRSRLHYARPTETLTRPAALLLLGHVREVMTEALAQGGTSFDSLYIDVNGQSGYFDRSLNAYGRVDEPCARCGTPIRRDAFMNRSSFTCPRCQPRPRRGRW
jgi:formamidopyrimidine-DNA glycosylase